MNKHYSVLLAESISELQIKPHGIYVDGTLGRAGHSQEICKQLQDGHLYAFDRDQQAIDESIEILKSYAGKVTFIHDNFSFIKADLMKYNLEKIDGLILDLGVSSPQFDDSSRGFSYRFDARLDMRMDQSQAISAYEVVNNFTFHELVSILHRYGEEKFAKLIARKIEAARALAPIETTLQLAELIKDAYPMKARSQKGHPAKKSFQAIRIAVNGELEALEKGLQDAIEMLNVNGRICVITFHSLEDRIVKELFIKAASVEKVDRRIPLLPSQIKTANYQVITKKPIYPNENELEENNRSHSAKLRVIERIRE